MTPPAASRAVPRPEIVTEEIPRGGPGWIARVTDPDHKAVGRMYIATALLFCAVALTELVMMRLQLLVPENTLMRPEIFDRLLSAYGVTALLMFAIPLLLGIFSYVVPLQIGARDSALPRLNALSYWLYLLGSITVYASFLYRPSEGGTFGLPPLSDDLFTPNNGVDAWATGTALILLGAVCFAVAMVATVRSSRAPGMVWRRIPLFSWAATVCSYLLLLVGPIMIAALTMLLIDRNFDGVFFEPGEGGAPLLYEHLSSIFASGCYAFVIVAAFGAISEIFPTFARQPQFGHDTIQRSLAAFAALVVLGWMQNMYTAPIAPGFLYFAMAMTLATLIPVGLILFNWIATLSGGATQMRTPMLFAVGAVVVSLIGLAGEYAQSVIPVSRSVAHTATAWGDTHFALIGGGVLGGFAALYYWFPKISGRLMGDSLGRGSFWAIVIGSIVMVLPIQLAGLEGMPTDVYKYFGDTGMTAYNVIGTIGSLIFSTGVILTLVNAAASYNNGVETGPDPWGGATLEWFTLSPPPRHNFDLVPDVRGVEPLHDIREAIRRRSMDWTLPPAKAPGAAPVTPAETDTAPAADDGSGAGETDAEAETGEVATATAVAEPEAEPEPEPNPPAAAEEPDDGGDEDPADDDGDADPTGDDDRPVA